MLEHGLHWDAGLQRAAAPTEAGISNPLEFEFRVEGWRQEGRYLCTDKAYEENLLFFACKYMFTH